MRGGLAKTLVGLKDENRSHLYAKVAARFPVSRPDAQPFKFAPAPPEAFP